MAVPVVLVARSFLGTIQSAGYDLKSIKQFGLGKRELKDCFPFPKTICDLAKAHSEGQLMGIRTFLVVAPSIWNSLSCEVQLVLSLPAYQVSLNAFFSGCLAY